MFRTALVAVLCSAAPLLAGPPGIEGTEARGFLSKVAMVLEGDLVLKGTQIEWPDGTCRYGITEGFAEPWPEDLGALEKSDRIARMSSNAAPTVLLLIEGADEDCDGKVTDEEAYSYKAAFWFGVLADYVCRLEGPSRAREILSAHLRGDRFEATVLRYRQIVSDLRYRKPFPLPVLPAFPPPS